MRNFFNHKHFQWRFTENGCINKEAQRYLCRGCTKILSSITGKVWYQMHKKDKFLEYVHCQFNGYSIRVKELYEGEL